MSKLWPIFLALAAAFALAGCTVYSTPEGFIDLKPTAESQSLADAANSVVEPTVGLPVEDIGGVILDATDEAAKVATDAASGNYVGLAGSIAALVAAISASIIYRKKRKAAKRA